MFLIYEVEVVFNYLGAGEEKLDHRATTLGISSTILILYNMIAWPYIHEKQDQRTRIGDIRTEKERAIELIKQLDVIVDFGSSIMVQVKNLAEPAPAKMDGIVKRKLNNSDVKIYDNTNNVYLEAKLKETTPNNKDFIGYKKLADGTLATSSLDGISKLAYYADDDVIHLEVNQ